MSFRLILGIQDWRITRTTVFIEQLVRGLQRNGHDYQILITEPTQDKSIKPCHNSEFPPDLSFAQLPVNSADTWAQRWETLERYLEERAPCIYLMLHDWRYNVVSSRLSSRIRVISVMDTGSKSEINQARQLGHYWDYIVTTSDSLHFKLLAELPHLAPKIHTVHYSPLELYRLPAKAQIGPVRLVYIDDLLHNQESLEKTLAIAAELTEQGTSYHLTILAQRRTATTIQHKVGSLPVKTSISIIEVIDNKHKVRLLEAHHIYLSFSEENESLMSIHEAMSCACIPLIPMLPSFPSLIIPGGNALIVNSSDVHEYVHYINLLSNDRSLLFRLSIQAFLGIQNSDKQVEMMIASFLELFEKSVQVTDNYILSRQRHHISPPSETGCETRTLPGPYDVDAAEVSRSAMWPNPPRCGLSKHTPTNRPLLPSIDSYKIFISASPQHISGVDVFAIHLVRGLREKGLNACILTNGSISTANSLLDLTDLPIEVIDYPDCLGWRRRWQLLINKLSTCGPSIYIPNYDYVNSCIATRLPSHVRVIGIGHSDDPIHYEHLCRIGIGCDAIVGVSSAITQHLYQLAPQFRKRLSTIPYGVQNCPSFHRHNLIAQTRGHDERLRIAFTGRLVRYQKRAEDVIAIAKELSIRNIPYEMVIIGDGDIRSAMEMAAGELMIDRIRFTGAQSNAITLKFIETCDVLLLPSSFEGLSISMLEAMSRAVVPVVSSIRSGVPDVITDGVNGLIAPVADIQAFADRIEWLSNNRDDLRRIAASASATINQGYLTKHMVDRYLKLLQQVVSVESERFPSPIVPASCIAKELTLSAWMQRVFSDPKASLRRVRQRYFTN